MSDPARAALATTLLSSSAEMQRLLAAWPAVDRTLSGARLFIAWGRAAGVAPSAASRLGPLLRLHVLARVDGTIDPEAQRVLQHFAAERLRAAQRGVRR